MIIQKKSSKKRAVKASNRVARRNRAIKANEDIEEEVEDVVDVAPEASDLLFEAGDVAELIAEVSGEDVAVTVDDDTVVFEVGEDDVYTVEAEGDEEVLESSTKVNRKKRAVKASRKVARRTRARR